MNGGHGDRRSVAPMVRTAPTNKEKLRIDFIRCVEVGRSVASRQEAVQENMERCLTIGEL
jgi:hypothetical protein